MVLVGCSSLAGDIIDKSEHMEGCVECVSAGKEGFGSGAPEHIVQSPWCCGSNSM